MKDGTTVRRALSIALIGSIAAVLFVLLSPPLDLAFSGLFWRSDGGFFLDRLWLVRAIYIGTRWAMAALVAALLGALIGGYLLPAARLRAVRGKLWFAVIALTLGPGLIVNSVFKDHWGRPRPTQISSFGGGGTYVPPLLPSSQCEHNCSFVSGHAAAGFSLITGAWLWPRRRRGWLAAGLIAGSLIGLGRIAQGGHFLSDVVGALAVVWLTNAALYRWPPTRHLLHEPIDRSDLRA